jgi:chromosome segregation ATPase
MSRQNIPAANQAYQQLAGMDLVPRGTLAGMRTNVPMPAATRAEQQYEATRRYDALVAAGVPKSQAIQEAMIAVSQAGDSYRPMSEYQLVSTGLRREGLEQQAAQNDARQQLAEQKAAVPARDPLLRSQILKLEEDIDNAENDIKLTEKPTEASIKALEAKRKRLQQLTDQYHGTSATRTSTDAIQILPPSGTATAVTPPIGRGGSLRASASSEVIRKAGGRKAVFDSKTKKFLRYAD